MEKLMEFIGNYWYLLVLFLVFVVYDFIVVYKDIVCYVIEELEKESRNDRC